MPALASLTSQLAFNPLEPVVNIYPGVSGGGGLPKHQDHRDLTVVISLSKLCEYGGGGALPP